MTNRLSLETSPYLRQHAENPVEWYPWGDEAFALARAEEKPVLLSIGYAACHWCHVMAHESFEDHETAMLMNQWFINIKVDREERPDVDGIYMQAVQAITGHGGWPMTMFLTPEGVPFFGGTYWPPEDRHGIPSFPRILASVHDAWMTRREEVLKGATSLKRIYAAAEGPTAAGDAWSATQLAEAMERLRNWYDPREGGFGGAPKFPQPQLFDAMLRHAARTGEEPWIEMVRHSFGKMVRGGLHDQLGGGFHRYTVDGAWMVPHFEKMLYDNALLGRLAVNLWQFDKSTEARAVAESTFAWVIREMSDPAGGWYASLDADSEGVEGKFYVWQEAELRALLGEDAELAIAHWGVTLSGNWEETNILHIAETVEALSVVRGQSAVDIAARIERCRGILFEARAPRIRPARDEKVLASWNGLMLRAMADGARAFESEELRTAALRCGEFLRTQMIRAGRVFRSWTSGEARINGFLEDYAAVALGFLALHQLTHERHWFEEARALADQCVHWFWDDELGAFFDTPTDGERLVTRPRDVTDNAIPSGTSLAVELLLHMAVLTGDAESQRRADYVLSTLAEPMKRSPMAFGHLLGASDLAVHGATEVAIAGDPTDPRTGALVRVVAQHYLPSLVLLVGEGEAVADFPLMEGRTGSREPSAYLCRGYACAEPASSPLAWERILGGA